MKAMLRLGSAWHDVDDQIRAVTEMGLDPRRFILCTDDCHSETLVREGHVNRAVKRAIARGLAPIKAIQMATLNTAEHFGVTRDVGLIAPGRFADLLIVSDLAEFRIDQVIAKGQLVAENGRVLAEIPKFDYPEWAKSSVHLGRELEAGDFILRAPNGGSASTAIANVIGVIENQAPTRHLRFEVSVKDGAAQVDLDRDIAKIAVVERHRGTGDVEIGFVHGFGFDVPCAVGSTVAHDSHQMIIVGTAERDMARAANVLAEIGGGQVVIRDGEVIGMVELPIAGLMSEERAELVASKAATVLDGFAACGCRINNPNMQLSLLALVVIPELRLSDLGLVDVTRFSLIPVIEGSIGT
jgi:adenine deaminase